MNPRDMSPEAKARLATWLAEQPESPAKALAKRVADAWDAEGQEAAQATFKAGCDELKLVRWVQTAVVDMCTAYRATRGIHRG